jgi:hypothetical protein
MTKRKIVLGLFILISIAVAALVFAQAPKMCAKGQGHGPGMGMKGCMGDLDLTPDQQLKMIDLKFVDLLGSWQHCSFPVQTLDEGVFEEGLGFDGSSIRGFAAQRESDLRLGIDWGSFRWLPSDVFGPGKVMVFGNGGSAASSQHFVGELVSRFYKKADEAVKGFITASLSEKRPWEW